MNNLKYVLLMRHAKRHRTPSPPASELESIAASLCLMANRDSAPSQSSVVGLSDMGRYETISVANRLQEHIEGNLEDLRLSSIIYADSTEAKNTAQLVADCWNEKESVLMKPEELLEPRKAFRGYDDTKGSLELAKNVAEKVYGTAEDSCVNRKNAVLLVGHQPILGWIAGLLGGDAYPIANSEMLCFEIATRFEGQPCSRLKWVISPSDKKAVEDLRDKIRSKMVVANLLSAFIAAALGFVAANMADRAKIDYLSKQLPAIVVAAVLVFVALVLYLTTMCSDDALLMPTRFWSESASRADDRPTWIVERPPSSISWILYQNMVHVWKWQFIPATYCLIMGLLTLIIATLLAKVLPHTRWSALITLAGPLVISAAIFVAFRTRHQVRAPRPKRSRTFNFGSSWRYFFGPWLGSED